jgi:hypothetical protein
VKRALLLALVLFGLAREARASADTYGQLKGDIRLDYTGTCARRFWDGEGGQHDVPLHGRYLTNEFTLAGDLGVLEWLDVNAALSGAEQKFSDQLKADEEDIWDLDSLTLGAKARFLDLKLISMAAEYELTVPLSTKARLLYANSAVDNTFKLDATLHLPAEIFISGYAGLTLRTGHYADLAILGVEPGFTIAPVTFYFPIDYSTPIDTKTGPTLIGRGRLDEPRPTTLTAGIGLSWNIWKGLHFDAELAHTFFGMNALLTTSWTLGFSYKF